MLLGEAIVGFFASHGRDPLTSTLAGRIAQMSILPASVAKVEFTQPLRNA
jgi:hypothetical protein